MARTAEEIRVDLASQYPKIRKQDGDRIVDLDPNDPETAEKYAALLDAWVEQTVLGETQAEEATAQRGRRLQIVTALTQMNAARQKLSVSAADRASFNALPQWGTATAAQRQEIVRLSLDEALQDIAGLVRVMQDLRQIEEA